jgi:hypothetical protein
MAHSLASDIRERVISFLMEELPLPEFQEWLVGATWDVEDHGNPEAINLTYAIKLALAEHGRGDISSSDLRDRLSELVETTASVAYLGADNSRVLTFGTTSKSVTAELESSLVHTQYAVASW